MTLILWPSHASGATARETEMFRFAASGSKSHTVVPSSTRPVLGIAPAVNSRASASVVLPDPPWPTSTTLRIFAVGNVSTYDLPGCVGSPAPGTPGASETGCYARAHDRCPGGPVVP